MTLPKISLGLLALAVLAVPASTQELKQNRIPLVVKKLQSRYGLANPTTLRIEGARPARDLADLVAIEQKFFPGAVVTAGFFDWRTVSRYRSHAGLHLGYDIAMPYGSPFGAGWPGVVTGIAVWSGEEHGITVESPDGTSVTYGHVSPRVAVGQRVEAGQLLGLIAKDHVDVKMRDASGNYLDFGGSGRVLPAPQWAAWASYPGSWGPPALTREGVMAEWLLASNNVDMAREEVEQFQNQSSQRKLELEQLRRRLPVLQQSVDMMAEYVEQGLVARVTAEENREELEKSKQRLKRLERDSGQDKSRLKSLQVALQAASERLARAKGQGQNFGLSFRDVEKFVSQTINNDSALKKNIETYKKAAQSKNSTRLASLESELRNSEKTLKSLEELYDIGGVAKNDLETAKEKHRLLIGQVRALKAQTQD